MKRLTLFASAIVAAFVLAACAAGLQFMFAADLTPGAEVTPPTLNGATPEGSATATLNADETELVISGTFEGLTGVALAAHIHGPAEEGVDAGILFPLTIDSQTSGSISGTWSDITAQEIEQLRDGLFYVNVHTELNGGGEIRGQLE